MRQRASWRPAHGFAALAVVALVIACGSRGDEGGGGRCWVDANGDMELTVSSAAGAVLAYNQSTNEKSVAVRLTLARGAVRLLDVAEVLDERKRHVEVRYLDDQMQEHVVVADADGLGTRGEIDHRAFTLDANARPEDVHYVDGGPHVAAALASATRDLLHALAPEAQQRLEVCGASKRGHVGLRGIPAQPEQPTSQPSCNVCRGGCGAAFSACLFGVATGCTAAGPFYGLCVVIGSGICFGGYVICWALCSAPGAPCCPVACGLGCCNAGSTCAAPGFNTPALCCPSGTSVCAGTGGINCCFSTDECIQKTGECCAKTRDVCGTSCCPDGAPCNRQTDTCCGVGDTTCGAGCCAAGRACCGTQCCDSNQSCTIGLGCTCKPSQLCAGAGIGGCCPTGETCVSDPNTGLNTCCPATLACGGRCCAPNEVCVDPSTSSCSQ